MAQGVGSGRSYIDVRVGARVAQRRHELHLTRGHVADVLGIAEGEFTERELGKSRFSASDLWELSKALGVVPGYFFEAHNSNAVDAPFGDWGPRSHIDSSPQEFESSLRPEHLKDE